MRRLRRWRALPAARRALAWRALGTVVVVRLLLLTLPFGAWQRAIRLLHRAGPLLLPPGATSRDVAWAVAHAGDMIHGATCLTRALATRLMLPPGGAVPVLRLGVRRSMVGEVQAHAWLETDDGVLIGQDELERYAPLGRWRVPPDVGGSERPPVRVARG